MQLTEISLMISVWKHSAFIYNYLRNPHTENYIRDTENKRLILKGTRVTLNDADSPTWIGIRQKDFDYGNPCPGQPVGTASKHKGRNNSLL